MFLRILGEKILELRLLGYQYLQYFFKVVFIECCLYVGYLNFYYFFRRKCFINILFYGGGNCVLERLRSLFKVVQLVSGKVYLILGFFDFFGFSKFINQYDS